MAWLRRAAVLLSNAIAITAIDLDISQPASIKAAAATVASDMMSFYSGDKPGNIPGLLPGPYYWWEAGAMFGALIDYWQYTNDSSYNDKITQAMLWQVGPNLNYMPPNQTASMGNDDQAFWGMAALRAAEVNFPNPPADQPQWLALAQGVYNSQALRWDTKYCGGGLRWQAVLANKGYDYKNSISNGAFFNIAARLARYTGNSTYADRAIETYDWMESVGFISPDYAVYDGAGTLPGTVQTAQGAITETTGNCTAYDKIQWTYNNAILVLGAANMYNYTNGSDVWKDRVESLLNATELFFVDDVAREYACENVCLNLNPNNATECTYKTTCDTDQYSFKAYMARWYAASIKVAPFVYDIVMPKIQASALAAAAQCIGSGNGITGTMCGLIWTNGSNWDGTYGVGQQLDALEFIQANLIVKVEAPVTASSGGTSQGNPNAGLQSPIIPITYAPITSMDVAGAMILTVLGILSLITVVIWMLWED